MRNLADTIFRLKNQRDRNWATGKPVSDRLVDLSGFGSNPGALRARVYLPPDASGRGAARGCASWLHAVRCLLRSRIGLVPPRRCTRVRTAFSRAAPVEQCPTLFQLVPAGRHFPWLGRSTFHQADDRHTCRSPPDRPRQDFRNRSFGRRGNGDVHAGNVSRCLCRWRNHRRASPWYCQISSGSFRSHAGAWDARNAAVAACDFRSLGSCGSMAHDLSLAWRSRQHGCSLQCGSHH